MKTKKGDKGDNMAPKAEEDSQMKKEPEFRRTTMLEAFLSIKLIR